MEQVRFNSIQKKYLNAEAGAESSAPARPNEIKFNAIQKKYLGPVPKSESSAPQPVTYAGTAMPTEDELYAGALEHQNREAAFEEANKGFWSNLWDSASMGVTMDQMAGEGFAPGREQQYAELAAQQMEAAKNVQTYRQQIKELNAPTEWTGREAMIDEYRALQRGMNADMAATDFNGGVLPEDYAEREARMRELLREIELRDTAAGNGVRSYSGQDRIANVVGGTGQSIASGLINAGATAFETMAKNRDAMWAADPNAYVTPAAETPEISEEELHESLKPLYDAADRIGAGAAQSLETAKNGLPSLGRAGVDIAQNLMEMGFDAAVGSITGGGSLASMFVRVYGQGTMEARQAGATLDQQNAYGFTTAAIEVFTEKMADGVAGIYGKGAADEITEKLIGKLTESDLGRSLLRLLIGGVSEGTEEVVSDLLAPFAKSIISDVRFRDLLPFEDGKLIPQTYQDQLNAAEILHDFLLGAAVGLIAGGGNFVNGGNAQANAELRAQEVQNKNAHAEQTEGETEGRLSIEVNPDGSRYVKADRKILSGDDPTQWGKQLRSYINEQIRKGQDVTFTTEDGHELKLTGRTAWKMSDRHAPNSENYLTDDQFRLKENAAGHIDELIQTANFKKYRSDENGRHYNDIGEDGFNYFEAFFEDGDGKRYLIPMSAGINEAEETAYSIGYPRKRKPRTGTGPSAENSGAQNGAELSGNTNTTHGAQSQGEKTAVQLALEEALRKKGVTDEQSYFGEQSGDAGERAGGEAGRSEGGQGSLRMDAGDEGSERSNNLRDLVKEEVTPRALGIRRGSKTETVQVLDESRFAPDSPEARAAQKARENGLEPTFILGTMRIGGKQARGYIQGNRVILQADGRFTAEQLLDHELYHEAKQRIPQLNDIIRESLANNLSEKELGAMVDRYIEAYDGVYDFSGMTEEQIREICEEELFADFYAGIDNQGHQEYRDTVRQAFGEAQTMEQQNAEAQRDTRGPPEGDYSYPKEPDALYTQKRLYSYDFLTHQTPMQRLELPDVGDVVSLTPKQVAEKGMEDVAKYGPVVNTKENGRMGFVKNKYTGHTLRISASTIRHGLHKERGLGSQILNKQFGLIVGQAAENSIPINGLILENPQAAGTYAMAGYAIDKKGNEYIAILTVEHYTNQVLEAEVLDVGHSISGRRNKNQRAPAVTTTQESPDTGLSFNTSSDTISIAELLDIVNNTYRSILPKDVLDHYGEEKPLKGFYTGKTLFSVEAGQTAGYQSTGRHLYRDYLERARRNPRLASAQVTRPLTEPELPADNTAAVAEYLQRKYGTDAAVEYIAEEVAARHLYSDEAETILRRLRAGA